MHEIITFMNQIKSLTGQFMIVGMFAASFFYGCQGNQQEPKKENSYGKSDIEIRVFRNDTTADSSLGGYGYNIYMYKGLYIHQPNIPAVNGNRGFNTATFAEKTGNLTAYKIRNNIMPPSLTMKELDSLGVLK